MKALLFVTCLLFREGLPFVVQPRLVRSAAGSTVKAVPCTRFLRGKASAVMRAAKTRVEGDGWESISAGDVCKGDLPTPGWVRLAQRNLKRVLVGDRLPDVQVRRLADSGVQSFSIRELFKDKKGVLVGVPGAFTPTCTDVHLPGYVDKAAELAAKGAELVAFVAVNDVYVMRAWEDSQANGKVVMLADGNGDLAAALGMMVDLTNQGMGLRCKRFVCVVDNGVVTYTKVGDRATGPVSASSVSMALDGEKDGGPRNGGLFEKLLGMEVKARAEEATEESEDLLPA